MRKVDCELAEKLLRRRAKNNEEDLPPLTVVNKSTGRYGSVSSLLKLSTVTGFSHQSSFGEDSLSLSEPPNPEPVTLEEHVKSYNDPPHSDSPQQTSPNHSLLSPGETLLSSVHSPKSKCESMKGEKSLHIIQEEPSPHLSDNESEISEHDLRPSPRSPKPVSPSKDSCSIDSLVKNHPNTFIDTRDAPATRMEQKIRKAALKLGYHHQSTIEMVNLKVGGKVYCFPSPLVLSSAPVDCLQGNGGHYLIFGEQYLADCCYPLHGYMQGRVSASWYTSFTPEKRSLALGSYLLNAFVERGLGSKEDFFHAWDTAFDSINAREARRNAERKEEEESVSSHSFQTPGQDLEDKCSGSAYYSNCSGSSRMYESVTNGISSPANDFGADKKEVEVGRVASVRRTVKRR